MNGALDPAAYRDLIAELEAVPLAARRLFLRERRPPPFERDRTLCNPESLRMALAAARTGHLVTIGRLHRSLHWSRQVCGHVLRWGERNGYVLRTATSTYRIQRLPRLGEPSRHRGR